MSMKMSLYELGYTSADVAALEPDRAAAIIDRRIQCPADGMPAKWKRGHSRGIRGSALGKAVSAVANLSTVGLGIALALHYSGMNLGAFSKLVADMSERLLESTSAGPARGRRLY